VKIQAMVATALVCVGLGFWALPASAQQSPTPCPSSICQGYDWGAEYSSTTLMASHRFQRHSAVTNDGAIHIVVNAGQAGAQTGALQLYTNTTNGTTWNTSPTWVFPYTVGLQTDGAVSTDDVNVVTAESGDQQWLQVAYDEEAASGGTNVPNALMYTVLAYNPTSHSWTQNPNLYPEMIASGSTTYQQAAIATDAGGNLWITDVELTFCASNPNLVSTGQIGVYERLYGAYKFNPITAITTNGNIRCNPTTGLIPHAPRPVLYVPTTGSGAGIIGLFYQSALCLWWVTINTNTVPVSVSTPLELSQYSNQLANPTNGTNCNLPTNQSSYDDTAASGL
jgi:hypothetical protein